MPTDGLDTHITKLIEQPDREAATIQLCLALLDASPELRAVIRTGWKFGVEWSYPSPERLACTRGQTSSPRERVVSGLILEALDQCYGMRENLIALAAIYRSCELAKLSPSAVFIEVAAVLNQNEADILKRFLTRSPEDRRLAAFGLKEVVNDDGEVEIHTALPPIDVNALLNKFGDGKR